jgi:hypothetical protein
MPSEARGEWAVAIAVPVGIATALGLLALIG